jgi:integral membrane protein (TIGR01906 family)
MHGVLLPAATAMALVSLVLLLLLTPVVMHALLDASGAPSQLGLTAAQTHALSDRTVAELLLGPGRFAFPGPDGAPFYGAAEAGHMSDVRLVLFGFLALAAASWVGLLAALTRWRTDAATYRAIARGAAVLTIGLLVVGAFALIAFNVAFELFHRILFPGGNWSFDPANQRLVQLYPIAFWQLTSAAFGVLGISAGSAVWFVARRRAARLEAGS